MPPSSRVTIKDVSRRAQVSVTTVSHALTGHGRVGAETRARILAVAEELGYVANPHAKALKSGRTMTVIAELPATAEAGGLDSAFLRDVLVGAAEQAMEAGYLLAIAGRMSAARSTLPPADGALVVDPVVGDPVLENADKRGLPIVTVTGYVGQPAAVPAVGANYVAGVKAILDHLADAGYERPGLLSTKQPFEFAAACVRGYEAWMADAGLRGRVRNAANHPTVASGRTAARAWLGQQNPPDAIIAVTEPLAVGALQAISESGQKVPDDIGVASVSDSERLRAAATPITALDLFPGTTGRRAMELLIDLIESGENADRRSLELPTQLHARASTARPNR